MKILLNLMLLFFVTNVCAQNGLKVTYDEIQGGSLTISQLFHQQGVSIYKSISKLSNGQESNNLSKKNKYLDRNSIYLVKYFKENKILYPAVRVFDSKKQIILDSLNTIKWKIVSNNNTKFLGRIVKIGKCRFRERNYTALYCPDIPIPDGPFKFNGLPGLILKISSDDNYVSFTATKIEVTKKIVLSISSKYHINQIGFWEYVNLAKKEMETDYKKFLSTLPPEQRNIKFNVKIDRIEMVF